ncbi:hypothetical protein CI102_14510 [Trichoderma harzianum]|nr:hypothetical protein CI102_14510 [Trichoderma harzianum]
MGCAADELFKSFSRTSTLGPRTDSLIWPKDRFNMDKRKRGKDDETGGYKRVRIDLESLPAHLTSISQMFGGVELSSDTKTTLCETIASSREKLVNGDPVDGVDILKKGIFSLHCAPDVVFKFSDGDGLELRSRWHRAMQSFASIHKQPKFDSLVFPRQTLFELQVNGKEGIVIAEERLPLANNYLVHKQRYESLGSRLEPALRNLTKFIVLSGFSRVEFKTIPILHKQELEPGANPKIGLVNLGSCGGIHGEHARKTYHDAFFGNGQTSRGLFRCIAPEHFAVVKSEASKHKVTFNEKMYFDARKVRRDDLEEARHNLELASENDAYENRAKSIFEAVATALSVAIPPTLEIITNRLDALDEKQQLFMATRWFRVRSIDQPDLILRGVMVLDPENRSRAALSMSIQGSIASSLADTTSLRRHLGHFCCMDLINREHTPEESKPLLSRLPDEEGLFLQHLSGLPFHPRRRLARSWQTEGCEILAPTHGLPLALRGR